MKEKLYENTSVKSSQKPYGLQKVITPNLRPESVHNESDISFSQYMFIVMYYTIRQISAVLANHQQTILHSVRKNLNR